MLESANSLLVMLEADVVEGAWSARKVVGGGALCTGRCYARDTTSGPEGFY